MASTIKICLQSVHQKGCNASNRRFATMECWATANFRLLQRHTCM